MSDTKTYRAISVKLAAFLCREKWSDELPEKTRKEMQRLVKEWQDVDRDNKPSDTTTERPGEAMSPRLVKHYKHAAHKIGDLFTWCVEHMRGMQFGPDSADWIDQIKNRLLTFATLADELVAVKANLDLVTSNFHTLLNERFLENSELRQRAEAAEMRMKELLDALRLCKLYGSQGDIDDGRKGAVSVSYYVDKAIDAAEAALATTPPATGAQS